MGGAYVAKPDLAVAVDYPPGWNIDWPFPGPYPPGYTPIHTMTMTADEYIWPGGTTSAVSMHVYDQGSYETNSPDGLVTWSATIEGETVQLKLDTGEEFANSITTPYAQGSPWGASPALQFDISSANEGQIIILRSFGNPFGDDMYDTAEITVVNEDSNAGITVDPTSGLRTTVEGGTDTFTVVLTIRPTATVSIGMVSSDETTGTLSTGLLTFDQLNWDIPQTVTVTGGSVEGDYTITLLPADSSDPNYDDLVGDSVSVSNMVYGISNISPSYDYWPIDPDGPGVTFDFLVRTGGPVTVSITSGDPDKVSIAPSTLIFTEENHNTQQTVTLTAEDGPILPWPGHVTVSITFTPSSGASSITRYVVYWHNS